MTQYLPPNLLALFAPRDPIPYIPPLDKLPHEKRLTPYRGVAAFLQEFEDPKDTPPPTRVETKDERKERKRRERAEQVAYKLEQDLAMWDPINDPTITGDPYKSLFIARINYDTSESKLRREFEAYGPVKQIRLVHSQTNGKPRGYAFVEFEHERDMHSAYKHADGKKIDGRRVLVDIERGRTIKGWRPRRLGGGLGGTRKGGPDVNTKYSGREENSSINRDDARSRSRERERDRGEKEREPRRRRSRSRERRRRSRSPRDRRRRGSRDRSRKTSREPIIEETIDVEKERDRDRDRERKRRRSRSRERDRAERKRSRSREKKRSRRSRSRDKRRSRDRGEERGPRGEEQGDYSQDGFDPNMVIKQEENGDDEGYGAYTAVPDDGTVYKTEYDDYGDSQDAQYGTDNQYQDYNNGDEKQKLEQPEEQYAD